MKIKISNVAQKHFLSLLSQEPIGTHIRVFIIHPGTPSAECGVAYCLKNEVEESDLELKYNYFNVYVNKNIISYLKNCEIDLITDKLSTCLTIKAPYSKKNFFLSESSLEKQVKNFLNIEINPQLLLHRGRVDLIKITNAGVAIIKFSGGCNGCAMIESTVKDMVEKKLLINFGELKSVFDQTNHFQGKHSFY